MKMRLTAGGASDVSIMRCCVASPQSKSHVWPPSCMARACWLRVFVGEALDVPRNVSSIWSITLSLRLLPPLEKERLAGAEQQCIEARLGQALTDGTRAVAAVHSPADPPRYIPRRGADHATTLTAEHSRALAIF